MNINKIDEIRFWSKVSTSKQNNGCWYWSMSKNPLGYGYFRLNKKTYLAHRLSLIFFYGEEKKDKFVLHSCDNPSCVNPNHLRWGDQEENIKDCINRKRKINPPIFKGENHPMSVLCWNDVNKIRNRLSNGDSITTIHKDYKQVSINALYRIKNYETWKVK